MTRAKTTPISAPAEIQPQAQPVGTYVRPADPAPSPLNAVAQGLKGFDKGLSVFLEKRRSDQDRADEVRAKAAFNKNNQTGWAEAVKLGMVPANASPVFVESYKKAQGNLAGIQLREKFNRAYQEWDGRNSNDPEAFQTFLGTFVANNIGTEDPEILAGLVPHLEALTSDGYEVFGTESAASVYNGSVHTNAAIAGETLDWANQNGLATGEGTDYGAVREDLIALRASALGSGVRMEDFDKQLVDTIRDKAVEHGDPQLLDLLDEVWPGYNVKLSSIPEFRDIKAEGLGALDRRARQQMVDLDKRTQRQAKEEELKVTATAARIIATDPLATVPEDLLRIWEKHDPMARKKVAELRRSLSSEGAMERPEDLLAVERLIQEGATAKEVLELAGPDGSIHNVVTLRAALDRVEKRTEGLRKGTGILTTPAAKTYLKTFKARTTPKAYMEWFAPEGLTDEGLEATRDFEAMLLEWDVGHPNATQVERAEAIEEVGQLILKRIDPEEREYISKADAEAIRKATETGQPNPNRKPPQKPNPYSGPKPPSLDALTPSFRSGLEKRAKSLGITPEDLNRRLWEKLRPKSKTPNH